MLPFFNRFYIGTPFLRGYQFLFAQIKKSAANEQYQSCKRDSHHAAIKAANIAHASLQFAVNASGQMHLATCLKHGMQQIRQAQLLTGTTLQGGVHRRSNCQVPVIMIRHRRDPVG